MSENVVTLGADDSGKTDSTAAFRKAIDNLGRRGGIIEIPVGRYRIDQAPIAINTPVHFRGEGGMVRSAIHPKTGNNLPGSVTTLLFPPDRDGFVVVAPSSANAHFENLALVRTLGSGPNPERFARRGIHAQSRIWAESLYLLNWERGIDLDGRTNHPADPDHITAFATNDSYVSRIFAEDCFWATYAHGQDAQASHFEHIVTLSCEAGIYDSSTAGNGYVDCYVDGGFTEPPYYMDNQSVLFNCHCESHTPPQLGKYVTVVGGGFTVGELPEQVAKALGVTGAQGIRQINGVPAKSEGAPFPGGMANFAAGEKIVVTVDGVARTVTFTAGASTPRQVAEQINAAFANLTLPRVATAYGFDNALTVEGWRGLKGTATVTGDPATLAKIGFPAPSPTEGQDHGQMLSAPECSHVTFRAHSGLDWDGTLSKELPGFDELLDVEMAYDAIRPMFWQIRGAYGDAQEFGILREAGKGVRRWAFTRASSPGNISLGFTMPEDSLGPDQAVAYNGLWLQDPHGSRILLCSGAPKDSQGTLEDTHPPTPPHDFAWDLAATPPVHYTRTVTGWAANPAPSTVHLEQTLEQRSPVDPAQPLELTLDQRSLVNLDDAAGRWQFEGGQVLQDGTRVADYAGTRRVVTGGTDTLNVAMLTLTLFFLDQAGETGDSMTLQGSHSFSSGNAAGSVSAASSGFTDHIGAQFSQTGRTLLIH